MPNSNSTINKQHLNFPTIQDIDLKVFSTICAQETQKLDYPFARSVDKKLVIYEGAEMVLAINEEKTKQKIKRELYHCLKDGPGAFVVHGFYSETEVVDKSTDIFQKIIREEKKNQTHAGDHFAKAGENERIWNSFQKACEKDPAAFIDYYKNPLYNLVSEAWLGPGYQITAQVNVVKPGGRAQSAHRDFHLGFQSADKVAQYPLSMQVASQYLTLQGAIAHSDMPLATGPTLMLPFSHQYELGYLAWRDARFKQYFNEMAIQLPLNKGDAVFFSPALFHAAGSNTTTSDRMANLIQVSSAFGKPMETIDRYKIMQRSYPFLLEKIAQQNISDTEVQTIVAAIADGYSFPTNLDVTQPMGGLAPETAQQLMRIALREKWPVDQFNKAVEKHGFDRSA